MNSLVHSVYQGVRPGGRGELFAAGTPLENPVVYDSAARELKSMAADGLVEITDEVTRTSPAHGELITAITFRRIR